MNFQRICRICIGENSGMLSIFESYNFSAHNCEIFKVITNCADVQIQKYDGFSEQICRRCLDNLSQAYRFKKLCEESDYKFRNNLIMTHEIKIKSEFSEGDTAINFGDVRSDPKRNSDENFGMTDVRLTQVKKDKYDDEINTQYNSEEFRGISTFIKCEEPSSSMNSDCFINDTVGTSSNEYGLCSEYSYSDTREWDKNVELLHTSLTETRPAENTFEYDGSFALQSSLKNLQSKKINLGDHTGEKPYKCDVCEKEFTQKQTLMCHVRIHTGEKPFNCEICNKSFSEKRKLVQHSRIHTGEKPYKCGICEKTFAERSNFVRHSRTHTGEKPYKCDFCEKDFTKKLTLETHIRTHTGEIAYKCEICEKSFSVKYNLVQHSRIHTGEKLFKCDICEKTFRKKETLTCHTRIHTGEKPYQCDICQKTFSARYNFVRHKRTHSGENPLKCDVCGKNFPTKEILTHHICIHTGDAPLKYELQENFCEN